MAYNLDTGHDSPNYTPAGSALATFGMERVIEGITLHWWGDPNQNPSFNGIRDYLCRAGGNTSAHYVATGTNRQVACIVSPLDIAWHSGSAWGNARTIGIELDPRGRAEDMDVVAELIADIRSAFGDVPLYWHNYFIQTTCPGVYTALIDHIDQLSYTKYSAAEWGQGGDINPKAPVPAPVPAQTPTTTPVDTLFKLYVAGKQVGAYSVEANAFKAFVQGDKVATIKQGSKDVTAELVAKYTTPSPTTKDETGTTLPDSGKPVAEKDGYTEADRQRDNAIAALLQKLWDFVTSIFKGGK